MIAILLCLLACDEGTTEGETTGTDSDWLDTTVDIGGQEGEDEGGMAADTGDTYGADWELTTIGADVELGFIYIGCTASWDSTLINTGIADLNIHRTRVLTKSSYFTFSSIAAPQVLAPADEITLSVEYAPLAEEDGDLYTFVYIDDPNQPVELIRHHGTGLIYDRGSVVETADGSPSFTLTTQAVGATMTVEVDGTPIVSGWSFDESTGVLTFSGDQVPSAGSTVEINYIVRPSSC